MMYGSSPLGPSSSSDPAGSSTGLVVNGNEVTLNTAKRMPTHTLALLEANYPGFTQLELHDNSLMQLKADHHGVAIAQALAKNTHVTHVTISKCNASKATAAALAETLKVNKTVRVLNLADNRIDSEGVLLICTALRNNESLEELNLMGTRGTIGEDALSALCHSLEHNITLKKIIWRLDSRQAWKITKFLSRNNEIERRREQGKSLADILPDTRK